MALINSPKETPDDGWYPNNWFIFLVHSNSLIQGLAIVNSPPLATEIFLPLDAHYYNESFIAMAIVDYFIESNFCGQTQPC